MISRSTEPILRLYESVCNLKWDLDLLLQRGSLRVEVTYDSIDTSPFIAFGACGLFSH